MTVQYQIQLMNLNLTATLTEDFSFSSLKESCGKLPTDGLRIWGFMCTRHSYKQKIQQNYEKNTSFKNTLYSVCASVLYDLMGHAGASLRAVQFSSKCFDYQRRQVPAENVKGTSGLISLFCFFLRSLWRSVWEKRSSQKGKSRQEWISAAEKHCKKQKDS